MHFSKPDKVCTTAEGVWRTKSRQSAWKEMDSLTDYLVVKSKSSQDFYDFILGGMIEKFIY